MSSARETILASVREALQNPSNLPETPSDINQRVAAGLQAITPADRRALAEQFKKEVETVSGECHLLGGEEDALAKLAELLAAAKTGSLAVDGHSLSAALGDRLAGRLPGLQIFNAAALAYPERRRRLAATAAGLVVADHGIADTGSLVIFYQQQASGLTNALPETVFALLPVERLLPHLDAMVRATHAEQRKHMVLITGPSRTADIEKILILGAHGPKRLVVMITGI